MDCVKVLTFLVFVYTCSFAKDSDFSIKKDPEEMEMDFPEVDDKSYENVQKIIKGLYLWSQ